MAGELTPTRVYRPVRQASPARRARGYQQTYNTRTVPRPAPPPRAAPRPSGQSATRAAAAGGATAGAAGAAAGYGLDAAERAGRAADRARLPTGNRQYQGVILAEFLAAVVLVAGLPIATGGSPNAKTKGGLSPYDTGDLKQLIGIGAVYFILALLSSGNRGRFAAWFGGLVLLGIGFVKTDQIRQAAQALGPQPVTG